MCSPNMVWRIAATRSRSPPLRSAGPRPTAGRPPPAPRLSRSAVGRVSTAERPRFAIGAMGRGTRTITVTANVTFDEVRDAYYQQARALIEGGMDALLLETCPDTM